MKKTLAFDDLEDRKLLTTTTSYTYMMDPTHVNVEIRVTGFAEAMVYRMRAQLAEEARQAEATEQLMRENMLRMQQTQYYFNFFNFANP